MQPLRAFPGFAEPPAPAVPQDKNVIFQWGVRIPLRDGVHLNATIYRPRGEARTPAIFTLTPYIADSYHPRGYYFAQNGYAWATVDCRGRGNSQGDFEPFVNEGRDGSDVVEWLASQPWCDGSVTMWGGSYGGFDQWMALKEFPPHLKTIVPVASAYAAVDFPFFQNIFYPYEMQWLTLTSGVTGNSNLFNEQRFWIEKFYQMHTQHTPFKDLDQVVGNLDTHFQTWLKHPIPDGYWQPMMLTPEDYRRIDIPILTITGHYDDDQQGAMEYYRNAMRYGSAEACAQHYLVVGPWDHPGTRTPAREFGGLKFGEAGLLDMNKLHKDWYDWTLKAGQKPEFLKQRVAYYLMGAEKWKYAESLEAISNATRTLYLNSGPGGANDVFHSGVLEESQPAGSSQPDQYVYDPLDVRLAELEREPVEAPLTNQRYDLNLFGNGLVYHSAPFEKDTEVTGFIRLALWLELDVPDTDFTATLAEILPDGSYIFLTQDLQRARYRQSLLQEKLVTPGEVNCYEFTGFRFFSRRIAKGSRLRLLVAAPNSIFSQKNYNSGGVVTEETAKDARTAHVRLHHDSDHPSRLELPLVLEEQA